jgi:predicted Ser/Thr protein kinase
MTDSSTPDSLRAGSRVGPWLVEGFADRGTYGVVFRAHLANSPGSLPVALKMARFPEDPRFAHEAHLLSLVPHPSIPRLLDRGFWKAKPSGPIHPFLVMEWIHGLTLYDWAQECSPSSRQVLHVLAQLSGALAALHKAGGLHRDVKGHNVLVEADRRAVLMDFGSGTWAGAPPLTDRPMAPGTPEYRSPEALLFRRQYEGQLLARYHAGAADDLYALGVSTYRAVTGRYPPPEIEPGKERDPYRAPPPPRLSLLELNPRLEPQLAALTEQMLAKEPSARGFALELEMAATAVAHHAGPQADAPLGPARALRKVAVPIHAIAPAAAAPSEAEAAAAQASMWAERLAQATTVAATLAVIGIAIASGTLLSRQEPPEGSRAEPQDGGSAPDAGTRGVGDSTATTRVEEYGVPLDATSKLLAQQLPDEPLDGQRRPPCRSQSFVAINGGCWSELKELPPNCGEDNYEWKNGCYYPVMERPGRPRTSKDPR